MNDHMYMVLPPDIDNLEDLELWKSKFDSMTYYQRKVSNDISIDTFGQDNITRYNKLKTKFLDKSDPNLGLGEITPDKTKADLDDIMKYFEESANNINLRSLAKKKITEELIKSYKQLKSIGIGSSNNGYAFFDKDNLVCFVSIEIKENNEIWIQALEVIKEYQNNGLGKQLLDFACKDLKAKFLSVRKTNNIALNMYKKYGFRIYKETDYMYFMTIDKSLKESSSNIEIQNVNNDSIEDKIIKIKKAESDGLVIMIDTEYGFSDDYPEESIAKLKEKWKQFQALSYDKRQLSNDTAKNILGVDNYILYDKILNKHLENLEKEDDSPTEDSYPAQDIEDAINISPYFTPHELGSEFKSTDPIGEAGGVYQWSRMLETLYVELDNTSNKEKRKAIKESIENLGWNPEIPFSLEVASKTWIRNNNNYITYSNYKHYLTDLRESYIEEAARPALEKIPKNATYENLKDKIVPVFVTLISGRSLASNAIKWFTDSDWSHAAIGFDSSLEILYSFNLYREGLNIVNGFSIEGKDHYLKEYRDMRIKVYALFVTPEQRKDMLDAITWYIENQNKTKYNFGNIFNITVRKIVTKHAEDRDRMICSQFVYSILKLANFKMRNTNRKDIVSPADIDQLANDARFYCMYEGLLKDYRSNVVDNMIKKIIVTLPLEQFLEEANLDDYIKSFIGSFSKVEPLNFLKISPSFFKDHKY